MTVTFDERSLPPASYRLPNPDAVFQAVLSSHPVLASVTVEPAGERSERRAPWLRHGVTRYLERSQPGEVTPISGVDVYAATLLEAGDLATALVAAWPWLKRVAVPGERAFISGAWVEGQPYRLSEPDTDSLGGDLVRFHLELGLRVHPAAP